MSVQAGEQMGPWARRCSGVSKNLVVLVPAAMLAGLIVGLVVDLSAAKSLILPLTMLMVYPMLVNFKPARRSASRTEEPSASRWC